MKKVIIASAVIILLAIAFFLWWEYSGKRRAKCFKFDGIARINTARCG